MVTVTYVDLAGFVQCIESETGTQAAETLAECVEEVRSIKGVYGSAAQVQAFWRRVNDRNTVVVEV